MSFHSAVHFIIDFGLKSVLCVMQRKREKIERSEKKASHVLNCALDSAEIGVTARSIEKYIVYICEAR